VYLIAEPSVRLRPGVSKMDLHVPELSERLTKPLRKHAQQRLPIRELSPESATVVPSVSQQEEANWEYSKMKSFLEKRRNLSSVFTLEGGRSFSNFGSAPGTLSILSRRVGSLPSITSRRKSCRYKGFCPALPRQEGAAGPETRPEEGRILPSNRESNLSETLSF